MRKKWFALSFTCKHVRICQGMRKLSYEMKRYRVNALYILLNLTFRDGIHIACCMHAKVLNKSVV